MVKFRVHVLRLLQLFLLVGPLLSLSALSLSTFLLTGKISTDLLGGDLGDAISFLLGSAVGWWLSLLVPPLWPSTWVPTVIAALLSGLLLSWVLDNIRVVSRRSVTCIAGVVCAACSAATHAYTAWHAAIFGVAAQTLASALVGLAVGVLAGAWPLIISARAGEGAP